MTGDGDPLTRVLADRPPPFALLHRPETTGRDRLDVLLGELSEPATLAGIPVPEETLGQGQDVLVIVPFRQIAERGFACVDDGAPLLALRVTEQAVLPLSEALARIPEVPITLANSGFDIADEEYAEIVRKVVADEIGAGAGANFVIKRSFVADIEGYDPAHALAFFRRLCARESGAYWTFIVHTGSRTFVGATPERHISLRAGTAVMNPVSGTYRYPAGGPVLSDVLEFLSDEKESDELYMVLDEELKMMARVCDSGGRVVGPRLKEMARLAHTEYLIEGRSHRAPQEILRETLFAPTVTGSPLESACRVISRYEPRGRGYYSGVMALIGREGGARSLDSAILIRTADIDRAGRVDIGVGATLVRHSDPVSEAAETRAKAAGLLSALEGDRQGGLGDHPAVRSALASRNEDLARFWLADSSMARERPVPALVGRRVLVVDAEDTFTAMIGHQLRSLGTVVTVRRFDEEYSFDEHDLVVMGPGPGDPNDSGDPRIAHLHTAIGTLLERRLPFLAVCLSHQVLSRRLGLDVTPCDDCRQGTRREIDLFGTRVLAGFYNTFAARCDTDEIHRPGIGPVEVSRDVGNGEVHALRGPRFTSMQFHAESVLTRDGRHIWATHMEEVLRA
ncbi:MULTISPECIES: chorismate-binding protein [unclassified Streptomyces]|uniref:anthranilate synthase family protein n=1 Tax=unclassified Streptomyces TaxID=2593676 RepID=UPI00081D758F|nr:MULTISPECIES: chorismate-binding protein [unclassified Streptomyces]MYZ33678.1 phenazine-specific anthranilate synthase component I [Streptomyces sp. SID4917]SCF60930.1 phenazine biosynthesis protein phzE [Streptomyces sp. MnatMP-M17]